MVCASPEWERAPELMHRVTTMSQSTSFSVAAAAAYVCTDQGAALAQAVLPAVGAGSGALHGGGLSGAARISTGAPIAAIVLAEIGQLALEGACEALQEVVATGATVILLGQDQDLGTYRALRKAGALDYFAFPADAADIIAALRQHEQSATAQDRPATVAAVAAVPAALTGRAIAVLGCNGGVGASLLAQNLGFHAASRQMDDQRVALLDADLRFGSQAIDLDRKDTPGLLEALGAPDRVDATFLGATMEKLGENLSLYAYQLRAGQSLDPLETALPQLVHALKPTCDAVIVDLPRHMVMNRPEMMSCFDTVILMIAPGYAGVNVASRTIAALRQDAPDLRILPVMAAFRQDASLSPKDIERGIGLPLATRLPRDDAGIRRAHRAARPLVAMQPRAAYSRAVQALWQQAIRVEAPAKPKRKPLWSGLFGARVTA